MNRIEPVQSDPVLTAKIVEWDRRKGFGFLQVGKQRVFLHKNNFAERHKKPEAGDAIRFVMGKDSKGRTCATNAVHVNDGGRITLLNLLAVAGLLVLPTIALQKRSVDLRWVGAYLLVLNALTCWAYASDKRWAREGSRRLPEAHLHLLELLGGWPGAFLAQRRFRHKCSKGSFLFVFWLIVAGYQFAALDSLQDWQLSRAGLDWIKETSRHHSSSIREQIF
jgi:uncharacterized membrane protein YsdA (DUF1294 family)/cold shock CspA family protein